MHTWLYVMMTFSYLNQCWQIISVLLGTLTFTILNLYIFNYSCYSQFIVISAASNSQLAICNLMMQSKTHVLAIQLVVDIHNYCMIFYRVIKHCDFVRRVVDIYMKVDWKNQQVKLTKSIAIIIAYIVAYIRQLCVIQQLPNALSYMLVS